MIKRCILLELIEKEDHEIKRHSRYCQELRILSKKIENKIDTIKLLNCFIDERYVVKEEKFKLTLLRTLMT